MSTTLHDVIVIGGGPAGVAAAVQLRRSGVRDVVLLEREPVLGGAPRHCLHSPFGMREFGRVYLGPRYAKRLHDEALAAGVDVRIAHTVVGLEADGSLRVTYPHGTTVIRGRRVMTATGIREASRAARLASGDRPAGVLTTGALQAGLAFYGQLPFRRPLVVGSELVSLSAILSCVGHGARPAAVLEAGPRAVARRPLGWLPRLLGIPFLKNAAIAEIRGSERVDSVLVRHGERLVAIACDGVLFTGAFTPESSLHRQAGLAVDGSSGAPVVDQYGRLNNPVYFAAGNLLRAVETGGWAYREGCAVARTLACDLRQPLCTAAPVAVQFDDPVKLVVPGTICTGATRVPAAFRYFQLRMARPARGRMALLLDGRQVWHKRGGWLPERRILVPIPAAAARARQIRFVFVEND